MNPSVTTVDGNQLPRAPIAFGQRPYRAANLPESELGEAGTDAVWPADPQDSGGARIGIDPGWEIRRVQRLILATKASATVESGHETIRLVLIFVRTWVMGGWMWKS